MNESRAQVEQLQQQLAERNTLLIKARTTIETLQSDLELARYVLLACELGEENPFPFVLVV